MNTGVSEHYSVESGADGIGFYIQCQCGLTFRARSSFDLHVRTALSAVAPKPIEPGEVQYEHVCYSTGIDEEGVYLRCSCMEIFRDKRDFYKHKDLSAPFNEVRFKLYKAITQPTGRCQCGNSVTLLADMSVMVGDLPAFYICTCGFIGQVGVGIVREPNSMNIIRKGDAIICNHPTWKEEDDGTR